MLHSLSTMMFALVTLPAVYAGSIGARTNLDALLGGSAILETFEGFNIASGNTTNLSCLTLSSTAVCNGQGPGLVVPGISIGFSGLGSWDGTNYLGSTSKEILAAAVQPLDLIFTVPVTAFGVDLRAFVGFPTTATLTILGTDHTTVLGTLSGISLNTNGSLTFAGWTDNAGIGEVRFTQTTDPWSPMIDNLEFGTASSPVPEPFSAVLVALGLAGIALLRKRRWVQVR